MKLHDVWGEILDFNNEFFPNWRKIDEIFYSNALAGEVGEVCGVVKARAGGGTNSKGKDLSAHALMTEMADVFIYLTLLAEKMGNDDMTFALVIHEKIQTIRERMRE
jgi:NTP pyrophosphatase (non-canonical NTP hydrolase)